MIAQTFKRWLNRLFAWWPWKQATEQETAQTNLTINGMTSVDLWYKTATESAASQTPQIFPPSITSVAIERQMDEVIDRNTIPLEQDLSRLQPLMNEPQPIRMPAPEISKETSQPSGSSEQEDNEQQLLFLRYLFNHGLINEGFQDEQVPDQYRLQQD